MSVNNEEQKTKKPPVKKTGTGGKKTAAKKPTVVKEKVEPVVVDVEEVVVEKKPRVAPAFEVTAEKRAKREELLAQLPEDSESPEIPDPDWPQAIREEWYQPRYYDPNRPTFYIGVAYTFNSMSFEEVKTHLNQVLWDVKPWEYKRVIVAMRHGPAYPVVQEFAARRGLPTITVPVHWGSSYGDQARIMANMHMLRLLSEGVDPNAKGTKGMLVVLQRKVGDGGLAHLVRIAEARGIEVVHKFV